MSLTIKTVTSKNDLKKFILFPHALYRDNPFWAPNLFSEDKKLIAPGRHPFHEHAEVCLFLAEDTGRVVGRISAHINHNHNRFHQDRVGFFGFFECIDSGEVAQSLLNKAADYVRSKGMDTLRGPMNFSTNESCGLLVNSFDETPYFMMPYNFPYYERLLGDAGFQKSKDLLCYGLDTETYQFERLGKVAERIQKRSRIALREVDFYRLEEEVEILKTIYNSAWEKNWGFVPMTDAEFTFMAHEMKAIVDKRLLYIALYKDKPAGFILCLPDINIVLKHLKGRLFPFGIFKALYWKRKINRIRIITMGVIRECRGLGIDIILYNQIANLSPSIGYPSGELGWVLEDNEPMNRAAKLMGAKFSKRYRIYDRKLVT
ncbi:N-acetyltransferase [Candidatus Sumerlaeota bacterium]|nr:N-acetyltransferase [Candidatus Sumerlaeota bacterium]